MFVFPAIDLKGGRCVRLRQGDPNAERVYSEDPAAVARHWVTGGASWLHVVNLDGAFQGGGLRSGGALPLNLLRLQEILQAVDSPIQFGGGLRSLEDIDLVLQLGATRVVLGSVAVHHPDVVRQALKRFGPERVVVALDARGGYVVTHGWLETSNVPVIALGKAMRQMGVLRAVYTDTRRDGMLSGVDVEGATLLARQSGLLVIASGGVGSLEDVRRLRAAAQFGVEGVIIGQALYSGAISLTEAIAVASTPESGETT